MKDDDLRRTLHNPDYWMPQPKPGIIVRAVTWIAELGVSAVMVATGIGGLLFVGWLLAGLLS